MNQTSVDHRIWTPESFLYDKLLTSQARTSGRQGSTPIEVYNSYLLRYIDIDIEKFIDIDALCILGADIMNFVETCGLEGIEPYFMKWYVWWRFRNQNLFGIHIRSTQPRFMFGILSSEYFEKVYPEYKFTRFNYPSGYTCERDATFEEIRDAFEQTIRYITDE